MQDDIDITGKDKALILMTLYNASSQQGMGFAHKEGRHPMTLEDAQAYLADSRVHLTKFIGGRPPTPTKAPDTAANERIERRVYYFDYVLGRPLKCDIYGDTFNPNLFDRDNGGPGSAAKALKGI